MHLKFIVIFILSKELGKICEVLNFVIIAFRLLTLLLSLYTTNSVILNSIISSSILPMFPPLFRYRSFEVPYFRISKLFSFIRKVYKYKDTFNSFENANG
jgi:hypothetical protein